MHEYVVKYKKIFEQTGAQVKNFVSEFNAWEENEKIFFDTKFEIIATANNESRKLKNIMYIENAKIEPIFVLRNNIVHVELAIPYIVFPPVVSTKYNSLDELKLNNLDWEQKIIAHTVNSDVSISRDINMDKSEDKWLILENKPEKANYIFRGNSMRDDVNFSTNWATFKLLTLQIGFNNIEDVDSNLLPL